MQNKINQLFAECFKGYDHPHDSADKEIEKLGDVSEDYYRKAKDIVDSFVWKNELKGITKHFMEYLAFKAKTEKEWTEQDCYRLSLIFLKEFDKRMNFLAALSGSNISKVKKQSKRMETFDKRKIESLQ